MRRSSAFLADLIWPSGPFVGRSKGRVIVTVSTCDFVAVIAGADLPLPHDNPVWECISPTFFVITTDKKVSITNCPPSATVITVIVFGNRPYCKASGEQGKGVPQNGQVGCCERFIVLTENVNDRHNQVSFPEITFTLFYIYVKSPYNPFFDIIE